LAAGANRITVAAMEGFSNRLNLEHWFNKTVRVTNATDTYTGRLQAWGSLGVSILPHGIDGEIWVFPWPTVLRVDLSFVDSTPGDF
jgi:hypothetical protein